MKALRESETMKNRPDIFFWIALIFLVLIFCPDFSSAQKLEQTLSNLCKVFSGVEKVGIIYADSSFEKELKILEARAKELKITLIEKKVASIHEVPPNTRDLIGKIDTLMVVDDWIIKVPDAFNYIMLTALQNNWKTIVPREELLAKGGLFYTSEKGEIVVNKWIMQFLKLTPKEDSPKITFYGEE